MRRCARLTITWSKLGRSEVVFDREPDAIAPDGMEVRILPAVAGGSMAHFRMPAGLTGRAVKHRTVEELWFVLSGAGEMWLAPEGEAEQVLPLSPGVSFAIPLGTAFQLRNSEAEPLNVIAVTMPPWPGEEEAVFVAGKWEPTVR